jgi:hypothetical protein
MQRTKTFAELFLNPLHHYAPVKSWWSTLKAFSHVVFLASDVVWSKILCDFHRYFAPLCINSQSVSVRGAHSLPKQSCREQHNSLIIAREESIVCEWQATICRTIHGTVVTGDSDSRFRTRGCRWHPACTGIIKNLPGNFCLGVWLGQILMLLIVLTFPSTHFVLTFSNCCGEWISSLALICLVTSVTKAGHRNCPRTYDMTIHWKAPRSTFWWYH